MDDSCENSNLMSTTVEDLTRESSNLLDDDDCQDDDDSINEYQVLSNDVITYRGFERITHDLKNHHYGKDSLKEDSEEKEIDKVDFFDENNRSFNKKKKRKNVEESEGEQEFFSRKINQIKNVLSSDPLDLEKLRELAISKGGLVNDEIRKIAWPLLMQVDVSDFKSISSMDIKLHKDYNQVVMDVNRTLKRFPPDIDESYRYVLMDQLTALIVRVLDKNPELHYYQGYHDVAITFLLVMGERVGYELVERLSQTHLNEFMRPSMERTTYYLTYLYPILKRANKKLYNYLIKSKVGTVFCLPWLITWYAHTLSDYRNVVRLYDFFLATPYLMPMYIAVAIVLHREKDILAEECDMAMQHFVLSQVPDSLPFEEILMKASELYSLYSPDEMQPEVERMFKDKTREEEEERKAALERRKKLYVSSKITSSGVFGILFSFTDKFYLSHRQKNCIKMLAFAFVATVATGIYGYYSNSPYLKGYIPWS
ncbi:UNVERIFIED_CONTAM: hypothetical protein RMT77_000202 [Armadillidium vulgare]